jgi:hypothetical protein
MRLWCTVPSRYVCPCLCPDRCCLRIAQILHQADFTIPVEIEGNYHNVYVIKRPGVDEFMKRVGELYEVVVFTASVSKVIPLFSSYFCVKLTDGIVWRPSS